MEELADIVRKLKPTVLIGAAAIPNVFTPEIIKDMASFNESPVIFALSNPTSKAECTAEQASFQFIPTNRCIYIANAISKTIHVKEACLSLLCPIQPARLSALLSRQVYNSEFQDRIFRSKLIPI